jgi:hypothetical protein
MKTLVLAALVAALAACDSDPPDDDPELGPDLTPDAAALGDAATPSAPKGVRYDAINGGSTATMASFGLCELVRHPMFEAAGLYRVESLTGVLEDVGEEAQGIRKPFTYVELSLLDAWYNVEHDTVARISGGPLGDGSTAAWRVSLKVGETVGLLLMQAPFNGGHYDLNPQGMFHERDDGGYSNGVLFTSRVVSAAELGTMVSATARAPESDPCPFDEQPDDGTVRDDEDAGLDSP